MTCAALLSCFLLLVASSLGAPNNAPWKSWSFCQEIKPNENNPCLVKAIQTSGAELIKGSSYFGTPSLDPLGISELSVYDEGHDKSIAVNISFKDVKISGLRHFQIVEIKSDWSNGKVSGVVSLKEPVTFAADYQVGGKVLLLPITGKGNAEINLFDTTAELTIYLKETERKNKKYFTLEKLLCHLEPKLMKLNLENLFNGNKALGDNMNNFLNENWEEVLKDLGPSFDQALSAAFTQIAARVFNKIPSDTLVPK